MKRSLVFVFVVLCLRLSAQTDSTNVSDTAIGDSVSKEVTNETDTVSLMSTQALSAINPASVPRTSDEVYRIKPAVDLPLTIGLSAWSIYGFSRIYSKDPVPVEDIESLRISDINSFDRRGAYKYSEKAANTSDLLFYGSMPLPAALLLFDKKIRKDAGKIGLLYVEAMAVTGLFYTTSNMIVNRYRPYAYNPNVPIGERTEGGVTNSFIAGHMALVGTSTFFMAKIYSDYHPESRWKWVFFTGAALATGTTGYLRYRAGKHFPSDVLTGITLGTLSGILVPHFHKTKLIKNPNVRISPFMGPANGLSFTYTFK